MLLRKVIMLLVVIFMNNNDVILLLSNIRCKVKEALRLTEVEVILEKIDKT